MYYNRCTLKINTNKISMLTGTFNYHSLFVQMGFMSPDSKADRAF